MKRTPILLSALLALVLAACGSDQTDATPSPTEAPTPTVAPTPTESPTPDPTASPDSTDDGGSGSGPIGELDEVLPDEIRGLSRQSMPGMEDMLRGMLSQQAPGMEDADFAWAMYGDQGELVVTAFSAPGAGRAQLEMLAQIISGSQVEGAEDLDSEAVTIGGKDVLRVSVADQTQRVFLYITDDAFFTIVTETEDLAAELLSQLP
ncbi:MAG TPA: hypothetical protein VLA76_02955 [Candidatus Angelobacter sp.]|nr:hypothetical protein [Candidatus Angelobacter sp.]